MTWRPAEADAYPSRRSTARAPKPSKGNRGGAGDALLAAEAGRHFEAITARIAVQHVLVVGTQTNRPDAEPWVKRAEAALEQLPDRGSRAEVDVTL